MTSAANTTTTAAAAAEPAITMADNGTVTIPLSLLTDDGLRMVEARCRAERIRRAARINPSIAAFQAADAEDAALEAMPRDVLSRLADRMAAGIPNGALA